MKRTLAEQITDFESKRAASSGRMSAIMEKAGDEGRTLEVAETEEYDQLKDEVKAIDDHIARLKVHESEMLRTAGRTTKITVDNTTDDVKAKETRAGVISNVSKNEPKGIGIARMAIAMVNAKGNPHYAAELAKKHWPDNPEVELSIKAGVEAGDTTTSGWASQLVPAAQQMAGEFLELLRPATLVGRISGFRRVPFNIAVPVQSGGGTYGWVGEARAKPVTSLTMGSVTLRWAKAAGIIVITKELAKFSNPSAELIVRNDMIAGITQFLDQQFVDPSVAEVSNISPASITNTITPVVSTGGTAATFRTDVNNVMNNFTANNVNPTKLVILMSATSAIALSLMTNALGQPEFPLISVNGGTIAGLPVIVSETVGSRIIVCNPGDILLAEENGIVLDASEQASLEMSDSPVAGDLSPSTGAILKSLWQNNLYGIRAEIFITWKRGRTSAVEYISGVNYAP